MSEATAMTDPDVQWLRTIASDLEYVKCYDDADRYRTIAARLAAVADRLADPLAPPVGWILLSRHGLARQSRIYRAQELAEEALAGMTYDDRSFYTVRPVYAGAPGV